jgi:hypothetical protein
MSLTPEPPTPTPLTGQGRRLLGWLAAVGLFLVYASFRQRAIWGADSFGYFELGKLFSEGRVHLALAYSAAEFPAVVPPGFTLNGQGLVVPGYPPGFPLLLAVGHLLGAPMLVAPALGVVSCGLLWSLLRDRLDVPAAAAFTLAWAFMPLSVLGGTMAMSDGVAATVLLAALLAHTRGRMAAGGWLLGLAIAVRPTNALFLAPFALLVRFDRPHARLAVHLALAGAGYAAYNAWLYGAPWRTGYGDVASGLQPALLPSHLSFYLRESWHVLSPVIVLLAALGLAPLTRRKLALLLWPVILALFYACWDAGGIDRWWWTRFLMPGHPLLFLLAAEGFVRVRGGWSARLAPERAGLAGAILTGVVALLPIYYVAFGLGRRDLWQREVGVVNHEVVARVASLAPAGSLVGTLEHASTCLLETELVPFTPLDGSAGPLVARALGEGRRVFLLLEPWNADHPTVRLLLERYHGREIARYRELWDGLPLYELTAP